MVAAEGLGVAGSHLGTPALWTQTNRIVGVAVMAVLSVGVVVVIG